MELTQRKLYILQLENHYRDFLCIRKNLKHTKYKCFEQYTIDHWGNAKYLDKDECNNLIKEAIKKYRKDIVKNIFKLNTKDDTTVISLKIALYSILLYVLILTIHVYKPTSLTKLAKDEVYVVYDVDGIRIKHKDSSCKQLKKAKHHIYIDKDESYDLPCAYCYE